MTIAVLGEALIDLIVGDDGAYRPHLGGSPYNVAIGLARQGVDVSYMSTLSDDSFGDKLLDSLTNENVEIAVKRRSLWPTSIALVTVDNLGQPTYRLYREGIADKDASFEEIVSNLPKDLRVFHTGSLAITPSQLPRMRKLFDLMRERGVLISVDINIRLRASIDTSRYLNGIRSLIRSGEIDIVKASVDDLQAFEISPEVSKSADVLYAEMGSGLLVLTEGTGGAVALGKSGTVRKKAYPVERMVDAVGAGDTFHAAFLGFLHRIGELKNSVAHIKKTTLADALDFACAAAAINVSRSGCSPPTYKQVTELTGKMGRDPI